jgi:hypothetical protein
MWRAAQEQEEKRRENYGRVISRLLYTRSTLVVLFAAVAFPREVGKKQEIKLDYFIFSLFSL